MDLSILYFLFPRLAVSRKRLARGVTLGGTKVFSYRTRKALPVADHQVLRILPALPPELRYPANFDKDSISVHGVAADGRVISFHWCGSTCLGIEFTAHKKSDMRHLVGVDVRSQNSMKVQHIDWVHGRYCGK